MIYKLWLFGRWITLPCVSLRSAIAIADGRIEEYGVLVGTPAIATQETSVDALRIVAERKGQVWIINRI